MNKPNSIKSDKTLKRIILLVSIVLLINPVILYLLSGNVFFSILLPLFFIVSFFLLVENKKLKKISILFFNFIIVFSFFIHSEAIFTYRFSDYIIEDLYILKNKYYFNRPYLNQTFKDKEFIVKYKTNKQGFRIGIEDDSETTVKNADWLFIGDSYTQGAQVQYEELYTSILFNYFPDKIIINAGISGFGIADEYNYYIKEGKDLKARKVFLQICNFNDFMNVKENKSGFSDYLMHYSNFVRYILYGFKYANPAELPLGRWTEPFYPDEKANENYNVFYKTKTKQKQNDLRNFEFFLNKFNEAVKQNGAELILVQIPTKEQVYYKYFDEVLTNFKIDVAKLDMNYPNNFVDKICKEKCIKCLDLLSDFNDSEKELFFQYDEHMNVNGHLQIAKSINNFLRKSERYENNLNLLSSLNVGDRYPNFIKINCNMVSYQSFRDGNMEIFTTDSLLQDSKRLTWNKIDEIHPWFSHDGQRLAFTEGNQAKNETKVVIMNIDGSDRRYITNDKHIFGAIPSFNYDGSKITYAEWRKELNTKCLSNPYIVVLDLSTERKLIITNDSFECWRPIFSPDGEKLFFISKENNNQFDVFEHSFLTNRKKNITNSEFEEWDVAISHDGKKIAYSGNKNGNWDLFLHDLEKDNITQLTKSLGSEWDVTFSPNDKYLYYSGTFGLKNGIFRLKLK